MKGETLVTMTATAQRELLQLLRSLALIRRRAQASRDTGPFVIWSEAGEARVLEVWPQLSSQDQVTLSEIFTADELP
jgi:hypothetical protein